MKSRSFFGIIAGILVSLAIMSCGSKPAVVETPPPAPPAAQPAAAQPARDPDSEPPDQAAIDQLFAALAQVDTSRKQALDIDAPGYFPPEWDDAEGQFASAKENASDKTLGDVKKAIALYQAAAETYDNLARQCIPFYYEDLADEIILARNQAIDAGIRDISPDRLEAADARIDQALELYEAGEAAGANTAAAENYYAAAASAFEARDRYHALSLGVRAYLIREEILERDFAGYDQTNYNIGEETGIDAIAAYDNGDIASAEAGAEEAFLRFMLVVNEGWISHAGDLKNSADGERRKALTAKANVAVKQEFDNADGFYAKGVAAYNAKDYTGSSEYFDQSIPLFISSTKNAEKKRVIAEDAIQTAETKVSQSDEAARDAEIVLQGGAK